MTSNMLGSNPPSTVLDTRHVVPLEPQPVLEAVAAPQNTEQLVRLVVNARRRGTRLRVTSAVPEPSQRHQSTLVVDLSGWTHIDEPNLDSMTVWVEPGASYRQVLAKTLPLGLLPMGSRGDLEASVGGTLATGGLGTHAHRYGLSAANVGNAELVLGTGDVVQTSPTLKRELYDCVFGGAGRFGIVTRCQVRLVRVPALVRTISLTYRQLAPFVRDLSTLAQSPLVQHLEGDSNGWSGYTLRASVGFDTEIPQVGELLVGLRHTAVEGVLDQATSDYLEWHHDCAYARREPNTWDERRRLEFLLPLIEAVPVLDRLTSLPGLEGPYRATIVAAVGRPAALALPRGSTALAITTPTPKNAAEIGPRLESLVHQSGGSFSASGSLPPQSPRFWRRHHGSAHRRMLAMKRLADPAGLFHSPLGPLD